MRQQSQAASLPRLNGVPVRGLAGRRRACEDCAQMLLLQIQSRLLSVHGSLRKPHCPSLPSTACMPDQAVLDWPQ
jgi:hypothetical protein